MACGCQHGRERARLAAPVFGSGCCACAGLLGFPPRELQYRFLCQFTPVFYIRQRDYSKARPLLPERGHAPLGCAHTAFLHTAVCPSDAPAVMNFTCTYSGCSPLCRYCNCNAVWASPGDLFEAGACDLVHFAWSNVALISLLACLCRACRLRHTSSTTAAASSGNTLGPGRSALCLPQPVCVTVLQVQCMERCAGFTRSGAE